MIKSSEKSRLIRLQKNPVKTYDWGSTSKQCTVSRLYNHSNQFNHFAELWMGAHPSGESQVVDKQNGRVMVLSEFLRTNNLQPLGFLFKVLSIQRCLSIQLHPNKQQAVRWHKQKPAIYGDDNDKPEMFYTLTDFECFMGYISQQQFLRISNMPIFQKFLPKSQPKTPKQMIIQLLNLDKKTQDELITEAISIKQQIHPSRYNKQNLQAGRKIYKILTDFERDVGIVVTFFLEYKFVPAGRCYFIEANMPHAYIYGECLEIMKSSDNVCRLGLTPKPKDLGVLGQALGNKFSQVQPVQPKFLNSVQSHNQNNNLISSELYEMQGLIFHILKFIQSQKSINPQIFTIAEAKKLRICLVIKGNIQISQNNADCQGQVCNQGSVILLEQNKQYKLINREDKQGLVCVGWSNF